MIPKEHLGEDVYYYSLLDLIASHKGLVRRLSPFTSMDGNASKYEYEYIFYSIPSFP